MSHESKPSTFFVWWAGRLDYQRALAQTFSLDVLHPLAWLLSRFYLLFPFVTVGHGYFVSSWFSCLDNLWFRLSVGWAHLNLRLLVDPRIYILVRDSTQKALYDWLLADTLQEKTEQFLWTLLGKWYTVMMDCMVESTWRGMVVGIIMVYFLNLHFCVWSSRQYYWPNTGEKNK